MTDQQAMLITSTTRPGCCSRFGQIGRITPYWFRERKSETFCLENENRGRKKAEQASDPDSAADLAIDAEDSADIATAWTSDISFLLT
jgi:hypothetical protein